MRMGPMKVICAPLWLATAAVSLLASSAQANVKLPNIFGNHMVLQQGQKNKIWGTADGGEAVTVTIGKQSQQATAATDGKWSVMLEPLSLGEPLTLTVKGKNEIKFDDVLVG